MDEATTRETEVREDCGYPAPIIFLSAVGFFIALGYAFIGMTQFLIGATPFVAIFPFQESYTNPELQMLVLEGVRKMLFATVGVLAGAFVLAIPDIVKGFTKRD